MSDDLHLIVGVLEVTDVPVTCILPRDDFVELIAGAWGDSCSFKHTGHCSERRDGGSTFFLRRCRLWSFLMRKSMGSGGNSFTTLDINSCEALHDNTHNRVICNTTVPQI